MAEDKSKTIYETLAKDHPTEQEFKLLLRHVAPGVLAKRYLNSGLPFVYQGQPHKYLAFREAVGGIYGVRPQDVAVMGSARFGFSTSPNKQRTEGAKPLDEDSDMDLVIVSMRLFEDGIDDFVKFTFQALRDVAGLKADVLEADEEISLKKAPMVNARQRAKALFYGYVSPGDLSDGTRLKQHFYDLQREANTQLFGTQPPGPISRVGARIYKDWEAAERSYEFSFRQLAKALGITAGKQGDDDE